MAERRASASNGHRSETSNGSRRPAKPAQAARTRPISPVELARRAADQLAELVGRDPEGVVSLERTDDGWSVGVEVVETHRIPETADILAEYAVQVDGRGQLLAYHRTHRYTRGGTKGER